MCGEMATGGLVSIKCDVAVAMREVLWAASPLDARALGVWLAVHGGEETVELAAHILEVLL